MAEWTQRLFDWEKSGRDQEALARHLRLCGLLETDVMLIEAIRRHGQWETEVTPDQCTLARSVLRACSITAVAQLAGLSRSTIHRAKDRLTRPTSDREAIMAYRAGTWVVSWSRVWAMHPAVPDFVGAAVPRRPASSRVVPLRPAPSRGGEQGERSGETPRAGAHQEPRKQEPSLPKPTTQFLGVSEGGGTERDDAGRAGMAPVGVLAQRIVDPEMELRRWTAFRSSVQSATRVVMDAVRRAEEKNHTPESARLKWGSAEEIVEGMLSDEQSGVGEARDAFQRILRAMGRVAQFSTSPAAYVVGAAQRRGWIGRKRY